MKRTLSFAAVFMAGTLFSGGTVFAATNYVQAVKGTTQVVLNSNVIEQPPKLIYGGTTYVQLYSIQQALKQAGVGATWDGSQFQMTTNQTPVNASDVVPNNVNFNYTSTVQALKGTSQILLNGNVIEQPPKLIYGGTTYVQLYSIQQALKQAGISTFWNGNTLSIVTEILNNQNITEYLNAVNSAIQDINDGLSVEYTGLSDAQNGNDTTSDANQFWTISGKIDNDLQDIENISIPSSSDPLDVSGNQSTIENDIATLSLDLGDIADANFGENNTPIQGNVLALLQDINTLESDYSSLTQYMKVYGVQANSIDIPSGMQSIVNNLPSAPTPGFTLANFDLINSSYGPWDVDTLFGINGTLSSESNDGTDDITIYTWQNTDGTQIVTVEFDNGQEVSKDQVGLE